MAVAHIEYLVPGVTAICDVCSSGGDLLVKAGEDLTEDSIKMLESSGVLTVEIPVNHLPMLKPNSDLSSILSKNDSGNPFISALKRAVTAMS